MSTTPNTIATLSCGACSVPNEKDSQFCNGCGQPLWEKCPSCSAACAISGKFCSSCGCDLTEETAKRIQQRMDSLERARQLAEEGDFSSAISLTSRVAEAPDYRFKESAENATAALDEYKKSLAEWTETLEGLPTRVEALNAKQKYSDVVSLLEAVPTKLLSSDLSKELNDARSGLHVSKSARTTLKKALSEKRYDAAASELSRLIELFPENNKYGSLLEQVVEKLSQHAVRAQSKGKHADALHFLDGIPATHQTEEHHKTRAELEEVVFLRRQVAKAPFAWPAIPLALQKLIELTPDDPNPRKLAEKFSSVRKTPLSGLAIFPNWLGRRESKSGKHYLPASLPASLTRRSKLLVESGAQFWPAYGMAVHAIGDRFPRGSFEESKKGGVLGLLSRNKKVESDSAWGIDIGDSSIKAILLSKQDDGFRVEDVAQTKIDLGSAAKNGLRRSDTETFRALKELLSAPKFAEHPIVSNVATSDVLSRYIEIPTTNPKKHNTFIEQEVSANIPIDIAMLSTAFIKFPVELETSVSHRVAVAAIRRTEIESRRSMFDQLQVNLVGLTSESFAYVNAIDALKLHDTHNSPSPSSAILILDVGHFRTSFNLHTRSGVWQRAIEWGIYDMTVALAQKKNCTYSDADKIRRNPVHNQSISEVFDVLREPCTVPLREIERCLGAARDVLGEFQIESKLMTGGGAYQALLSSWLEGEEI